MSSKKLQLPVNVLNALLLSGLLLFISCTGGEKTEDDVTVLIDTSLNEKNYVVRRESCAVSLTLYNTDLNREVMKYRNSCNFDPYRDTDVLKLLLTTAIKDVWADSVHTVSWGRLTPDIRARSILGRRLAMEAFNSKTWNRITGKASGSNENKVVQDLLNSGNIFNEVDQIFKENRIEIRVTAVEKVIVYRAEELPDFDLLQEKGIKTDDRLPIDCQVWLRFIK